METVDFLKQFKGFSHFRELDGLVQKLEDHVYSKKINRKPVIDFEKNENLKGIEYLEILYQSIIRKNVLEITYQSFNARHAGSFLFYPYLLKEFRNRWFLFGLKNNIYPLINLAIDRIINVKCTEKVFIEKEEFNAEVFFKDVIGVTVNQGSKPEKIVLFINRKHAPYVLTKPIHPSQKLIERDEYGITISLEVQHNYELEKEILGLGDGIVVISPERLKKNIFDRLNNAVDQYNTTLTERGSFL
jgi:predicted DNA-binding transcriptional regulator YafY